MQGLRKLVSHFTCIENVVDHKAHNTYLNTLPSHSTSNTHVTNFQTFIEVRLYLVIQLRSHICTHKYYKIVSVSQMNVLFFPIDVIRS